MNRLPWTAVVFCLLASSAIAQSGGVVGDWRTPDQAVVRIAPCGADLCAILVQLGPDAPSRVDGKNPDESKRSQKLCGLQIGYGFHLADPSHAEDGRLYDPKSGKTYRGAMTSNGDQLSLRGYVGLKAFGRTETWTRVPRATAGCS